jgi:hypothetical protein
MYLDQMGVPLTGSWEEATQTLTISSSSSISPQQQQQDQDEDGSSSRPPATAEQQQPQQQLPPEMLLGSPDFDLRQWLQALKHGVTNRQHIEYAQLPLQVR